MKIIIKWFKIFYNKYLASQDSYIYPYTPKFVIDYKIKMKQISSTEFFRVFSLDQTTDRSRARVVKMNSIWRDKSYSVNQLIREDSNCKPAFKFERGLYNQRYTPSKRRALIDSARLKQFPQISSRVINISNSSIKLQEYLSNERIPTQESQLSQEYMTSITQELKLKQILHNLSSSRELLNPNDYLHQRKTPKFYLHEEKNCSQSQNITQHQVEHKLWRRKKYPQVIVPRKLAPMIPNQVKLKPSLNDQYKMNLARFKFAKLHE